MDIYEIVRTPVWVVSTLYCTTVDNFDKVTKLVDSIFQYQMERARGTDSEFFKIASERLAKVRVIKPLIDGVKIFDIIGKFIARHPKDGHWTITDRTAPKIFCMFLNFVGNALDTAKSLHSFSFVVIKNVGALDIAKDCLSVAICIISVAESVFNCVRGQNIANNLTNVACDLTKIVVIVVKNKCSMTVVAARIFVFANMIFVSKVLYDAWPPN